MKIHTLPLVLLLVLSLFACAKKTDVKRPAEKPSGVKGGWTIGSKNYLFELSAGNAGSIQGTVKVIEGSSCKQASLQISAYQSGWLKGHWDKTKFIPCKSETAAFVEIPREVSEKIAAVRWDMSRVQLPDHFVIYDLPQNQLDLAPVIFGTASAMAVGRKSAGFRPVLKVGAEELKGIVIADTVLRDPLEFENLETPVSVRTMQLDTEDADYARKGGKAFCLHHTMPFVKDREKHRSTAFAMLRNVVNGEFQSYQFRAEEAECVK